MNRRDHVAPAFITHTFHPTMLTLVVAICLIHATTFAQSDRQPRQIQPRLPDASSIYVRKPEDRRWQIRFNGPIQVPPGIGVIVHDRQGVILVNTMAPAGDYSREAPYVITVPADGKVGDYRIVLTSHRENLSQQVTPITDFDLEVYAGPSIAMPHHTPPMHFVTPADVEMITITSRFNRPDIRATDQSVPTQGEPVRDETNWKVPVQVSPGVTYRMRLVGSMGFYPNAYFAYDAQRLFVPDPQLDNLKWWRLFREEP